MKPLALVGHAHNCPIHGPGTIVSGATGFTSNGRLAARVGDKISCGAVITTGSAGFTIDGQKAACAGDRTDHGGTLLDGEPSFLIGREAGTASAGYAPISSLQTSYAPDSAGRAELHDGADAHIGSGPCGPLRVFNEADITVIQSYDTVRQIAIPLAPDSTHPQQLKPLITTAVRALNRAGREVHRRELCEHVGIFNRMMVYMSVETVADAVALVSSIRPPFDLIVNSEPFSRTWDGSKVGVALHELHHFSLCNFELREEQIREGKRMGTGTGYENDCYLFQAELGFPRNGVYDFDSFEGDL